MGSKDQLVGTVEGALGSCTLINWIHTHSFILTKFDVRLPYHLFQEDIALPANMEVHRPL